MVIGVAVLRFRDGNQLVSLLLGMLGLFGLWTLVTFPLRFSVSDLGIQIIRPLGPRLIEWKEVKRICRMPGTFYVGTDANGGRRVSRRGGNLMVLVGARRVAIDCAREDVALRASLIDIARRNGVTVMPSVLGSESSG